MSSDDSQAIDDFKKAMELCEFNKGIGAIWQFISIMNKYIDSNKPWALAKENANIPILETILYNLIEGLRVVSCLIYPIMPQTSLKMQKTLGMEKENKGFYTLKEVSDWGQIKKGWILPKPDSLFPRIDGDKSKPRETAPQTKPFKPALKEQITIKDFEKIDLRTGIILSAEKIEKSKKLLKLTIDLGAEERQIIAGIAKDYSPDQIIGKQVIVVANLKEATLMGEISQGMILAANNKKNLVLSGFDREIMPGNPVK